MQVAIVNIVAEVARNLILFCNLYRNFINRLIDMAFLSIEVGFRFFFDTHCIDTKAKKKYVCLGLPGRA